MQLRDCYKTLFYSFCDLKLNWLGSNAQWLEDCTPSTAPEITIKNYEVAAAVSNQATIGGKTLDGPGCW